MIHSATKWLGGHGAGIGGVVVDSGRFNWAGGKHPLYDTPDASYHGLRWGHDLPDMFAPLAYILRMRTGPLRNLGAYFHPTILGLSCRGLKPCRCVWSAIVRMHLQLPSTCRRTTRWIGCASRA